MNIIKVNYNNAYIKLPAVIFPFAIAYHEDQTIVLVIHDNLESSDFYTDYKFDIYINNELITNIDIESDKEIIISDPSIYNSKEYFLKIVGYYISDSGNKQDVNVEYKLYNSYLCSESTICSELTICNDL